MGLFHLSNTFSHVSWFFIRKTTSASYPPASISPCLLPSLFSDGLTVVVPISGHPSTVLDSIPSHLLGSVVSAILFCIFIVFLSTGSLPFAYSLAVVSSFLKRKNEILRSSLPSQLFASSHRSMSLFPFIAKLFDRVECSHSLQFLLILCHSATEWHSDPVKVTQDLCFWIQSFICGCFSLFV